VWGLLDQATEWALVATGQPAVRRVGSQGPPGHRRWCRYDGRRHPPPGERRPAAPPAAALAPIAIVGLYFTPVSLIGCADRGLLALAVVAVSTAAAFVCVAFALRTRSRGDRDGLWWAMSALVLTLPLALLLGPLG